MFNSFAQLPLDPIFQLQADFIADPTQSKVNLGIGLYADEQGNPVVLETVKKAYLKVDTSDFNYQPIGGNLEYLKNTARLLFQYPDFNNIAMQATCGGTQAIRMFADLVLVDAKANNFNPVLLVGLPTWGNHLAICKNFEIQTFNHLGPDNKASLKNHQDALAASPNKALLLLHGGRTHNPSGQNLSQSELLSLAKLVNQKEIFVLIDAAYFGFGDDFKTDSKNLTELFAVFDNVAVAFSYSKNASLYEHRTGALFVKTNNKLAVESQLQQLARESVSMAPGIGQEIMNNVFANSFVEWEQEVTSIRQTLTNRRQLLVESLPSRFAYLAESAGMFGLLPFSPDQILELRQKYSIYFPNNGRINIAGINTQNLNYLVQAFTENSQD